MTDAIGGYFSLELSSGEEYHKFGIRLNTGRNCLEYILRARKYNKVYIPYYTCDVVLEPFRKLCIPYEFYHIDINLELNSDIHLKEGEALLYTNYYGLKQRYIEKLAAEYGKKLIVDNTQAFYATPVNGVDSFNTCRKFFGVPDGAYLFTDTSLDKSFEQDVSYNRMTSLIKRIDLGPEAGFEDFHNEGDMLCNQPIRFMSKFTQSMLMTINYEKIKCKRRENFIRLHHALNDTNAFIFNLENDTVPMIYPYLTAKNGLRQMLINNRVFVAKYWPNVEEWVERGCLEWNLANNMVAIPIDQRYDEDDMDYIVRLIKSYE